MMLNLHSFFKAEDVVPRLEKKEPKIRLAVHSLEYALGRCD